MEFSITAIIVLLSLILSTQVITLFVQHRLNRDYKGIGYWLLGSGLMSLGYIFMPMVTIEKLIALAIISNPLVVLGYVCLYLGIKAFPDKKPNKRGSILIFVGFNLFYYYFMIFSNSISARAVVITTTYAMISFMIAFELLFKKDKLLFFSTRFTAIVFFVYGIVNVIRSIITLISGPTNSYTDQGYILVYGVVFSIVMSNLWTFGLIIMVNQRLMIENQTKNEKMQLIFNTNIDPQIITRMKDDFIIDVNDKFSSLSGYPKDEIIGSNIKGINFWNHPDDREHFINELKRHTICQNMDFILIRKDGSEFAGSVSARIITIDSEVHIISVIRDITQQKLIETQMEALVQQLEIERNTAQINAITDSLTKLYNRRFFDKMLRTEFYRLRRSESTLSLVMLDIDHFKKFNDTYGHLAGDKCLEMISATLESNVERASDVVARYGGEEFIVILPELDENGARIVGEKIRKGVEDLAIPHITSETAKYVTVSVGVVTICPIDLDSPDQVIIMVDDALYEAKAKGRNCCVYGSNGSFE